MRRTGLGYGVGGQLACLLAAVSYALAGIFGRRFKRLGLSPLVTATGQVTATTVMMAPIAAFFDRPWTLATPSLDACAAVLALALLSTALGYVLYFRILAAAGATNLLLVTFLMPIGAVSLGALVLGEHLAPRQFLGMALIGLGLAAIDGRPAAAFGSAFRARGRSAASARLDMAIRPDILRAEDGAPTRSFQEPSTCLIPPCSQPATPPRASPPAPSPARR